jgi:RNA polymerase sigma-70 factor, ECF subfamily
VNTPATILGKEPAVSGEAGLTAPVAEGCRHREPCERSRQEAFALEALPHLRRLYAVSYRLTRSVQDAEDLVQETCLRAYRAFEQYKPGTDIRAWLFTILYRARTDDIRRAGRRLPTVSLSYEPASPTVTSPYTTEDLERALRRLPESYRAAVLLRDVEGCSYQDVALRLKVPIGTVESRLHRGRALLRSALADGSPSPRRRAAAQPGP